MTTQAAPSGFVRQDDLRANLDAIRTMARAGGQQAGQEERLGLATAFGAAAVRSWWQAAAGNVPLRAPRVPFGNGVLPEALAVLARLLGEELAGLDAEAAAYELGRVYMAMLPPERRTEHGVFYTPPVLTARLVDDAEAAGITWATARVLDPACGGGAFLTPVAERMIRAMEGTEPAIVVRALSSRLRGYEIDPFGAWLSQVALDVLVLPLTRAAGRGLGEVVIVCDSLERYPPRERFDLVIGNPPYGRVRLPDDMRARYRRSLHGHANLYGLFTDLALRHAKADGVVAYITPTSFLAGRYFTALRRLLGRQAPPVTVDVVRARKGVFDDALQETALAVFQKGQGPGPIAVRGVDVTSAGELWAEPIGTVVLPRNPSDPWVLPRERAHGPFVARLAATQHRLADWGWTVSTGPLVWNRHKPQLRWRASTCTRSLIWAEAVGADGTFRFPATKPNHPPHFALRPEVDDWLLVDRPCVLLQRTTAKEQARRLIAAPLTQTFLDAHDGAVVVENHLNMVRPVADGTPKVSAEALAAFLNGDAADAAFRCISGSVAVSAYELEAMPVPPPSAMRALEETLARGVGPGEVRAICAGLYEAAAPA